MNENLEGINVKKDEDFSEWYNQIVLKAELADYAPIQGFMIIRENGYSVWNKIQDYFNPVIKKLGIKNAYFPLLVPESFLKKEAEHAKGFAPEMAWLEKKETSDERYAIRPTSETVIYDSYSKWIRSYRDLPILLNQWCNVLRWEVKQTKLFLRTREFLWQEGHCAFSSFDECEIHAKQMIEEYRKLAEDLLAVPVIVGYKTKSERFAGADTTYTIEALMPDGKALQMGTSHNLGQNFAKAFNVNYIGEDEKEHFVWQSSWGVSTRLLGAIIMVHSDDNGLILPPRLAEHKIVIVPIVKKGLEEKVLAKARELKEKLSEFDPILDDRDYYNPGWKYNEWELKGIPLRIEIGPRDVENNQCVLVRRDNKEKEFVKLVENISEKVNLKLDEMQNSLFSNAKKFLTENIIEVNNWDEFKEGIKNKKMVLASFCEDEECEASIREEIIATSRCIPINQKEENFKCVKCSKDAKRKTYFAKAY